MRGARRRAAGFAALLAVAVLTTGCTPEDPPEEVREGPGPLSRIVHGTVTGDDPVQQAIADMLAQEERIALCMHEAGFEYRPMIPLPDQWHLQDPPEFPRGTVEYAERYGFGWWLAVAEMRAGR